MPSTPIVLACGLATVDVIQTVQRVPVSDEKVTALGTAVQAGGPALNGAVTAALLGVRARLVAGVGGSRLAEVVRADCAGHGVELADVAGDGFLVPISTVLLTEGTGERAVVSRNTVGVRTWDVPAGAALEALLDGVAAVLVDGHALPVAVPVAAAARAHGIPVLLDGGSWKPGLDDLLAHVDVLVASADFRAPGGDDLAGLLRLGPRWVARTAGAGAVLWAAAEGLTGEVAVPRVGVVDTLGAGDVLHGALLADIGHRGAGDLPGSLAVAVEVASRSVSAAGPHGWAWRGPGASV